MKTLIKYLCCLWLCYGVGSCAPLPEPPEAAKVCKLIQIEDGSRKITFSYSPEFPDIPIMDGYTVNGVSYGISEDNRAIYEVATNKVVYLISYQNGYVSNMRTVNNIPNMINNISFSYSGSSTPSFVYVGANSQRLDVDGDDNISFVVYYLGSNLSTSGYFFDISNNTKNPYQFMPFPIYWALFGSTATLRTNTLSYYSKNNLISSNLTLINRYNSYNSKGFPLNVTVLPNKNLTFIYDGCD